MSAVERLSEVVAFIFTKTPLTGAYIINNPSGAKFEKTYQPFPKSIDIGKNKKFYSSGTSLTARVNGSLLKIDDVKPIEQTDDSPETLPETLVIFSGIRKALTYDGDKVTLGNTGVEVTRVSGTEKSPPGSLPLGIKKQLEDDFRLKTQTQYLGLVHQAELKVIPPGLYVVRWSCGVCGWRTPKNEGIIQKLKVTSTSFSIPEGVRKTHAQPHKQGRDQYLTYLARPHMVGDDGVEVTTSIKFTGKVKV